MTKKQKKAHWQQQCQNLLNQFSSSKGIVFTQYPIVYALFAEIEKEFSHYKKFSSSNLKTNLTAHKLAQLNPLAQLNDVMVSIQTL